MHETIDPQERAFLVGGELKGGRPLLPVEASLEELARLADTAGMDVVGRTYQKFEKPDRSTYIGSGKVDEVKILIDELSASTVVFDEELSPRHQRELEKIFGEDVKVLDRTALILDIFAQHAQTREGKLQVELAQLEYRVPRLTRMWTHLARQAGGRVGGAGGGLVCAVLVKRSWKQTVVKLDDVLLTSKKSWMGCVPIVSAIGPSDNKLNCRLLPLSGIPMLVNRLCSIK